jgi:pimeloyl-ACP methyl ester carboxylesterase
LPLCGTRRRSTIAAAVASVLLLLVFTGKYLVGAFFPNGQRPLPTDSTERSRKCTGRAAQNWPSCGYGPNEGPALVFTHGWGADRRDWSYAISALPADVHVVVWDLPGLGESSHDARGRLFDGGNGCRSRQRA